MHEIFFRRADRSPSFIANLVLQRTGPFLRLGGASALGEWFRTGDVLPIVVFLQENRLLDDYLSQVCWEFEAEFEELIKILPEGALKRLVSIGPGNGLMESRLLSLGQTEQLLLIDIEQTDSHHHGYAENGSGYANLVLTKEFLRDNGSGNTDIFLCNPRTDELPIFPFSACISLLSMGFHYPCSQYAKFIVENIAPRGNVVLDRRLGQSDEGYESILRTCNVFHRKIGSKSERVFISKS